MLGGIRTSAYISRFFMLLLVVMVIAVAGAAVGQKKPEPSPARAVPQPCGRFQIFNGEFAIGDHRFMNEIILLDTETGRTWMYRVNLGPKKESGWVEMRSFVPTEP
jgi:hypothetical protein